MPSFIPLRIRPRAVLPLLGVFCLLDGCSGPRTVNDSPGHLKESPADFAVSPPAPQQPAAKPPPTKEPVPTYTVVVKNVPVTDLIFSLARDAGLNLDLQADQESAVTLNAIDRPLPEILERIAGQTSLRFEMRGNNLIVQKDTPYWKNYRVDYVNISRNSEGEVGVATQIATSGGSVDDSSQSRAGGEGNTSKTTVKSTSKNDFWTSLEAGLIALLQNDMSNPAAASPVSLDPVIVNRVSGIVTILGSQAQQQRAQRYLDSVIRSAQRQVLIEMTIVEVELSDNYQAGVDWQRLSSDSGLGNNGVSVRNNLLGSNLSVPPFFSLGYNDDDADGSNVSATVKLLQEFGDTKVLSSPKIMALNNQTALLKVVNENVFFTVELDIRDATADIPERRTFTSELHTVPVGLVLSVTPQISQSGYVNLNIRPTISRITGFAVDPAPRLAGAGFDNLVPEIQVREIESLLQVQNGRTVILGGLMQNEQESEKDGVPGLSRIPKVGKLFSYTRDKLVKTELVIFLKSTIVNSRTEMAIGNRISDYYDAEEFVDAVNDVEYR